MDEEFAIEHLQSNGEQSEGKPSPLREIEIGVRTDVGEDIVRLALYAEPGMSPTNMVEPICRRNITSSNRHLCGQERYHTGA